MRPPTINPKMTEEEWLMETEELSAALKGLQRDVERENQRELSEGAQLDFFSLYQPDDEEARKSAEIDLESDRFRHDVRLLKSLECLFPFLDVSALRSAREQLDRVVLDLRSEEAYLRGRLVSINRYSSRQRKRTSRSGGIGQGG